MTNEDYRILIVEDDADFREPLVERFTEEKFMVDQAENGEEALARVEENKPDLVLLDIIMPKMNGITFLKELNQKGINEIQIIVLTNMTSHSNVANALQYGAESYLVKAEWDVDQLVDKVRRQLGLTAEEATPERSAEN